MLDRTKIEELRVKLQASSKFYDTFVTIDDFGFYLAGIDGKQYTSGNEYISPYFHSVKSFETFVDQWCECYYANFAY